MELVNYKCPSCTAPLRFDEKTGKLVCDFCGSIYTVEEAETLNAEKEAAAAKAEKPDIPEASQTEDPNLHAYLCPSCGAELICEITTAATSCPYCGNVNIVPGQLSGELKPDFVIPFQVERKAVVEALHKHYGKHNFYLPKLFRTENHIQKVQGVYVPFWLYDARLSGEGRYEGMDSVTRREGDYEVTRTRHYDVERAGTADFVKVPVDASKKMPDNYMDSLEPYDYDKLAPFSTAYLPGFLADRYDESAEDCAPRMQTRCENALSSKLRSDVNHTTVTQKSFQGHIERKEAHYALLPVWMLTTKWRNKNYLFAMNGQTGKMVGELPTDPILFCRNVALLTLLLTLFFRFSGLVKLLILWIRYM